jgi:hypothetical protein
VNGQKQAVLGSVSKWSRIGSGCIDRVVDQVFDGFLSQLKFLQRILLKNFMNLEARNSLHFFFTGLSFLIQE